MNPGVGLHLMLDGESTRRLVGRELVDYVRLCTESIEMTLISNPRAYKITNGTQAHGIIAESHIMYVAAR